VTAHPTPEEREALLREIEETDWSYTMEERDVEREIEYLEGAIRRHLPSAKIVWTARERPISDRELSRRERAIKRQEQEQEQAAHKAHLEALTYGHTRISLRLEIAVLERMRALGPDAVLDGHLTTSEWVRLPEVLFHLRARLAAFDELEQLE
jgi:hypothetical protein